MNMRLGLWSVNSADYTGKSAERIAADVLGNVRPGAIILMHSGVPATVEALPMIVTALRERGYRFVTLRDLWNPGA
jgi:peptidoglycan/xylan/chitin deacetylase (PgdA/CDA1 family)